jgi:hypothetical protein
LALQSVTNATNPPNRVKPESLRKNVADSENVADETGYSAKKINDEVAEKICRHWGGFLMSALTKIRSKGFAVSIRDDGNEAVRAMEGEKWMMSQW